MVSRDDLSGTRLVTVNNACNQSGFYEIPTDDLEAPARVGHDPEMVEGILAQIEGESKQYFDEILGGAFPPAPEARFRLSMYIAMQITRGWGFRRDLERMVQLSAPHYVELQATPERVRDALRRSGQPHSRADVENMIARLTGPGGPRPVLRKAHYVQNMLRLALESIMPLVFCRHWRLLDFGQPLLLTGDEPVAVLRPEGETTGIADSRAIWLPLDRQHALALTRTGTEQIVPSGPVRASQVNLIVAAQAERWIFHHPDDRPLAGMEIGPRTRIVDEVVGRRIEGDTVRELHHFVKTPFLKAV
jgi:hypothetical protein